MEGGRDPFFGFSDPFGSFGGFGGFGPQRSLISSFFGGRDPFDDPFFQRPFGGMFQSSFFGPNGGPLMSPNAFGFLEHQPFLPNISRGNVSRGPIIEELSSRNTPPLPNISAGNVTRGPIIEELSSDEENEEKERERKNIENPRKHGRSNLEPFVEHPDEGGTEKKSRQMSRVKDINQMYHVQAQPQTQSFTFQSSSVSYGVGNGAYYTSSRTRRTGSDGLTFEECKEADSTTRQATHMVSRGIHDKGHSVTRKLNSDGHVDTVQTLHNLNEDELVGFDNAWGENARRQFPRWGEGFTAQGAIGSSSDNQQRPNRGGWALPSAETSNNRGSFVPNTGEAANVPPRHSGMKKNRHQ